MTGGMVPQTDPGAAYRAQRSRIDDAVRRVLESGWYILGEEVSAFEAEFASHAGAAHAVAVASGTDALEIALRACGIGEGSAVFTVAHTAVATVAAIVRAGATPVLVDVEPDHLTLDPERLAAAVEGGAAGSGARPRAVIPVHLYGQPADLPAIAAIARRHDLVLVEDCAQAHGARLDGRPVGSWGDAAAYSFYPTKNLGAFGDGGLLTTVRATVADAARSLRQYGWRERYVSEEHGTNSRLDELQAAILRVRLERLEQDNERRRAIARRYDEVLAGTSLRPVPVRSGAHHVYHQYAVRVEDRDRVRERLRESGVGTLVHYPVPVHRQPAYAGVAVGPEGLPVSERAADEVLSLPMFPELTEAQIDRVCASLANLAAPAR